MINSFQLTFSFSGKFNFITKSISSLKLQPFNLNFHCLCLNSGIASIEVLMCQLLMSLHPLLDAFFFSFLFYRIWCLNLTQSCVLCFSIQRESIRSISPVCFIKRLPGPVSGFSHLTGPCLRKQGLTLCWCMLVGVVTKAHKLSSDFTLAAF